MSDRIELLTQLLRNDLTDEERMYYVGSLYKIEKQHKTKPVHLYFIVAQPSVFPKPNGHVKIGVSYNPYDRIKRLQTGNPFTLRMLAIIEGVAGLEHEIHERIKHLHVRGEWFVYTEEIDDIIKELRQWESKSICISNR